MKTINKTPKVYLIGAGPGDPDLITVKAIRAITEADVILCDRLVSPEIVDNYMGKETELVYVGKECSKKASTPQSSINELMVEYALQNKTVARLKGGDVSIFSNILDELQVLKENKIAYEIIPGVTAALGAAAYAGMPLTARGYATSVRFLTYYKSEIMTEDYWKEIAETNDTLVFYMSVGNLTNLVDKFKEYDVSSEKKIAVIEQATTPFQKVYTSSFKDFAQKLGHKLFASPSLVVIGKIVNLHEEFSWLQNTDSEGLYFKSITNGSLLPKTQNFFEYAV
ncbi:uroporphyrinogen-III C-methyltransferase [Elizabethkingia anophelis]|uniref:uroporphyrinogen-III C-methyltransferase n=1 Tax=Elizabethkingia anophelis TaxID=1117645 RepID=A0AAU8V7F9_9FLAO|nr:uroporphyrinogen-III C-methyltransferase [Elizabethkingia anophelis]AQW94569.1 uroporphyrinogen-III C-methyltransferase [Elizabethkingia anophelis]AQX00663.1 uroporphyrinogen-III C-methyltransferase [Elizabethkingia anophelis]MCL1032994.1 uroporphyrinogen-III C-methyltransferase [Elizabethkingia anophelis]MCW2462760.1 uroporphyrin-III C-methyltransferase/precorrin-2 dehydrogenase/sirohydrochlorin ferrochelatase [Elizabethkingia anophelis]MCW2466445.1 uroporphyrin-III C-methyltransferase/pre